MKRILIAFCAAIMLTATLTGCNTMRGAGTDIENAGESIQDAVN